MRIIHDEKPAKVKKEPKIPKIVKKSTPKPIKPKEAPKKTKAAPKAPAKPKTKPKVPTHPNVPDEPVAPERPRIDYHTCPIDQLAEVLYDIQEPDCMFMELEEIRAALSNPTLTVGLCDQFLKHTMSAPQFFDRWEDSGQTEDDISALRTRLNILKLNAQNFIASTAPDEPPAPVEKPKKGILKRKSKAKSGLDARASFLKRMSGPMSSLKMCTVPLSASEFTLVDPAHICMIRFQNRNGESFFGLPDEPGTSDGLGRRQMRAIDLMNVRDNLNSYYDADGNPIPARLKADANEILSEPKMPQLDLTSSFILDPKAFKKEIGRSKKMLCDNPIRVYSKDGDLMISAGEDRWHVPEYRNGLRADVGDGPDTGVNSTYPRDYINKLVDFMLLADGPCTMTLESDYPFSVQFTVGDWDILAMLAPIIEED